MALTPKEEKRAKQIGRTEAHEAFDKTPLKNPPEKETNFWPTIGGKVAGDWAGPRESKAAGDIAKRAYEDEWAKQWESLGGPCTSGNHGPMILICGSTSGRLKQMGVEDRRSASVLCDNPSQADLARACHEIIGAASSLILNVEFLAESADPTQQEAVDDSRRSIDVIVALARAIKQAIEKGPCAS